MDDSQFSRIVDELPRLRRYAQSLTHDPERSSDLVQECAVRAMDNFSKWEPGTNLRSWLMTILHNIFINEMLRRRPYLTKTGDVGDRPAPGRQHGRDGLRDVNQALRCLTTDQQEIVWLACVEEREFADIAKQLGIPPGTVRSRLCRAREQLRRELEVLD